MKQLSIRNVTPELAAALQEEQRRRGGSLNATVIGLLRQALGLGGPYDNGLARFAGTWSDEELAAFEEATASFAEIDEDLWK